MKENTASKFWKILIVFSLLAGSSVPALAAPTVYSGYDIGAGSLAASPNATSAAAGFDAATSTSLIDFESALPAGVGISGGSTTNNSGCSGPLCGYNTTLGGSSFQLVPGGSSTFTFTNPIEAFGAYFTGWQIVSETLVYQNSSTVTLTMPPGNLASGGTVFFGFLDPGAQIISITYNALNDIVAVDDVRFGTASSVPEPISLVLMGLGLAGLAGFRRFRR